MSVTLFLRYGDDMTNGLARHYHLCESTFILGGIRPGVVLFFIHFFKELSLIKQNRLPRWDSAFCGVTSGPILFANVPQKGRQAYMI